MGVRMKNFIEIKDEHKYLLNLTLSEQRKKVLFASIQLDLFTQLEEAISAENLQKKWLITVKTQNIFLML